VRDSDFSGTDLARWLQEAGRRRVVRRPELPEMIGAPAAEAPLGIVQPARERTPRYLLLSSAAALAYLPYFFADVYVQIANLPCVIVFV
jgi:hypothetical protein